ncbi:hypothetical protein HDV03_004215 [Kappamyces sp. JEL0829]|nr:hypothetical protein HDV03_004215 [Kappamyces sp. JEL0829]
MSKTTSEKSVIYVIPTNEPKAIDARKTKRRTAILYGLALILIAGGVYFLASYVFQPTPAMSGSSTVKVASKADVNDPITCKPGEYTKLVPPCSAGSGACSKVCTPCPIGTYSSLTETLSCTTCPNNWGTASTGSTSIDDCIHSGYEVSPDGSCGYLSQK